MNRKKMQKTRRRKLLECLDYECFMNSDGKCVSFNEDCPFRKTRKPPFSLEKWKNDKERGFSMTWRRY